MKIEKKVNLYYLHYLLTPFSGAAVDDEAYELYQKMQLVEEVQFKELIRKEILPMFLDEMSLTNREKTKLALSYVLTQKDVDLKGRFNLELSIFEFLESPRSLFLWIWEELFFNESYELEELDLHKVVMDYAEPNRFKKSLER